MRIIVGISGASGVILGYRLLRALKEHDNCTTYLVMTDAARRNFELETTLSLEEIAAVADYFYDNKNLEARISSGSYVTTGIVVAPCSMKSLSAIASGYTDNLLTRAVDVCLKENRRVILSPREMPLGKTHLKNLFAAADLGCTIIPPMLTFYNNPQSLDDQIDHIIGKILQQFNVEHRHFSRWQGQ
jgi:4-hydroxy-3-polyprenylbenzoate decarboxylase